MSEKPVILFESYPDFNGSALAVYEELVRRGYDKKYDLVWAVYSDFNLKTDYKIVKFFNCNSAEKQNILKRTKCIIDSNRYIFKHQANNAFRFHVRHGCYGELHFLTLLFVLESCICYQMFMGGL